MGINKKKNHRNRMQNEHHSNTKGIKNTILLFMYCRRVTIISILAMLVKTITASSIDLKPTKPKINSLFSCQCCGKVRAHREHMTWELTNCRLFSNKRKHLTPTTHVIAFHWKFYLLHWGPADFLQRGKKNNRQISTDVSNRWMMTRCRAPRCHRPCASNN